MAHGLSTSEPPVKPTAAHIVAPHSGECVHARCPQCLTGLQSSRAVLCKGTLRRRRYSLSALSNVVAARCLWLLNTCTMAIRLRNCTFNYIKVKLTAPVNSYTGLAAAQLATSRDRGEEGLWQCSPVGRAARPVRGLNSRCTFAVTAQSVVGHVRLRVSPCFYLSFHPSPHHSLRRDLWKIICSPGSGSDPGISKVVTRKEPWLWGVSAERFGCCRVSWGPGGGGILPTGSLSPAQPAGVSQVPG